MSKMNETELRRRLGLLSGIEPSPQATGRALDRVRQGLAQNAIPSDNRLAGLWGIPARSRMAGLGVAAALFVGAVVLVSVLCTGPLDGTTAAYAKVAEAVRSVPWMRMRYSGYTLDDRGNTTSAEGQRDTEIWYSFHAQVVIYRYAGGTIVYYDYAKREVQRYNPTAKRIVVSAWPATRRSFGTASPWDWLEESIEQITSEGGSLACKKERHNGRKVEVFEVVAATGQGVATIHRRIFVDPLTSLPFAEEWTFINTKTGNPQLVETAVFDYPEQGPADIYGLGLSRDIPTVSGLPFPPWSDVSLTYQSFRRERLAQRYVAVVTQAMTIVGDPVTSVEVVYAEGSRLRQERHFLYHRGAIGPQWQEIKTQVGDTLDSILRWSRAYEARGEIMILLWVRDRFYDCRRDGYGSWSLVDERVLPRERTEHDSCGICPIAGLAWPDIRGYADIIQDDYAREHGLIRVEGEQETFYLNPQRDYICQQRVPFGRDRTEMTEFAQTETGRWYPRRIDDGGLKYTIYLDTDPEFPEGIFDPNNLPKAEQP